MANAFDAFDNPVVSGARDVGTAFAIGSNSLLKMAGDLATLTTGKKTGLSQLAQENIEYLQRQKSPELVAAEQEREAAVNAEENPFYQAWSYIKKTASDPRLLATTVAETAPSAIGPGALGAGARVATGKLLAKKGAEFATKAGIGTAIGAGTAMQAADVGGDQFDELLRTMESMDDDTAMQIPQVADLVQNKGATIPEAKGAVALELARKTALGAGAVSAVSQMVPGGRTIERALVGKAEKAAAPSIARAALAGLKGAAGEATQESIEEGGGQTLKNILARAVEPEREAMAGVGPAVGQAVIGAGALGGMAGVTEGRPSRPEATPRPVPASQVEAGISDETPAPAATKPSLAAEQQATLERSEEMTSDQFWATVNIRQARLMGGEPNPEDVRLVGDVPAPRVIIDPDVMYSAVEETQQALNDWRAKNPNAPENMVIVFDPEMLHNGFGIQGAFNQRDGSIFINAAFVSPENVGKIASHEWAHATLASPEGQRAFAEFAAREIPQEDLDALATRYGTQDRMVLLEEWIAENQEKAPGVISRIVARIREWLSQFGIVDLNDQEVADIMLRNLREQSEGKIQPDTQRVEGGIAPDQNLEVYETFIGNRLDAGPKFALQKLPTAADVTDAKGNLRYTIPKKTLDVSHYSFVPDLTEVDPAYYGTGRGEHYHRMMKGINKSFFFVGNSKPKAHENVAGKGMNRYRTTIDSSRIYDMDKDPLDLWFAPNPQKSEGLLKELGYDGFLAKTDDGRSFVALFYPTSLETGEVTRAAQPVEEAVSEEPQESAEEYLARVEREEAAERRKALRRASAGKYSLTQEPERISGIMASPSITDIQYDRAKRNLTSANQARFKSQITDYAPDADIFDAVGDWVDGAENSVAAIFRDRKPVNELQRLAAQAGLAGDQKAVLWWSTDPKGVDAIHEIVWPKGVSMDDARQAMIDVGLENRTLIQTPDGIRGFVFDQGRQNLNKIEALHEHETQPSLDSSPASGDFLGSWSSRAEGRRAYRRVLGSTPQTETGAGELRSEQVGTGSESETRFSLAQTKTPEFKAWFGDSQIVDADGNPQVLYHGTFNRRNFTGRNEDFTIFRPKSQNEGQPGVVFASPNPQLASEFTGITPSYLERFSGDELGEKRPGARVYPVYVRAENPFDYENPSHVQRIFGDEDYIELIPGSEEGGPYGSVDYDGVSISRAKVEKGDWVDIEYLLGKIKDAGFDGAYVSEPDSTGKRTKNIAVFDPDQLKSATGNVGAFGQRPITAEEAQRMGMTEEEAAEEQRRGDIRFSLAQTKTPEFKRFFGDWDTNPDGASKVVDENGKPRILFHGTIAGLDFAGFNTKSSAAGSHFATIPAVASSFAKGFRGPTGSRVIPVYLNIRNPWRSRDLMDWSGTAVIKEWANQHGQTYEKVEQEFNRVLEEENAFSENDTRQVQLFLKSKGHDGIVYLNRYEVYAPGEENIPGERYARMSGARRSPTDEEFLRSVPEATDAWIAFDPEQIKSATGNVGAFGQRPVTAEEAQRMGLTEEEAAEEQKRGDIRMSLTGKPVGEQALEDAKRLTFSNQKEVSKYLGELLRKEVPEGLDDESPEARRRLAELLDRELSLALTMPENADAIGWYSREMDKVFEILRSPELDYQLDDPINRGVFNAILAITSNGQKVVPQFLKTAQLYEGWRKTGQIPSVGKWGGERSRAIKNHVKFLNQMLEAVGPEQTVKFLTSEQSLGEHLNNLYGMVAEAQNLPEKATVKDKKAAIRKYLNAKMPGGELVDYNAVGAIVFGPKLGGGFFANLYGKFDRLTMDRWFMRTFHRMTGRLGEDRPEMVQSILKEARMEAADVLPEDVTDEEILNEITTTGKQAFKDYKEIKRRLKQDPNDTEAYGLDVMRRLYNRYLKAKSGLYDAPDNGSHRKFIREVLDEVQKLRAERGETKIETSDIQAILWYLEKDIWNRLRQSMDADAVAEADAQQDEDEGEDEDTAGRVSYSDGARELYRRKARREYGEGNEKPKERVLAGA